ncbi:MAG: GNAT family N-acetyltransferase [Pseudomonadota bacterium]
MLSGPTCEVRPVFGTALGESASDDRLGSAQTQSDDLTRVSKIVNNRRYLAEVDRDICDEIHFSLIRTTEDQTQIGTVQARSFDLVVRSMEMELSFQSRGNTDRSTFFEGISLIVKFFTESLRFRRISTVSSDLKEIKLLQGIGFAEETLLRQAKNVEGRFVDLIGLAIVRDDRH